MNKHYIAPSILAADFANLEKEIDIINNSMADYLHVDVMDGRFVPNISFGQDIVKRMGQLSEKPMDVHLMIVEPEKYLHEFRAAGAEMISVHYEACPHLHRTIEMIKDMGAKAGVALNPHTPVSVLEDLIEYIDLVVVMSVNPGFGGQKFIYQTLLKLKKLREMRDIKNSPALIEVDGGVGLQNAEAILNAGADILVAGSSVFKAPDPISVITRLKALSFDTSLN
jgi:ribulose-phosphate 3-epimerase